MRKMRMTWLLGLFILLISFNGLEARDWKADPPSVVIPFAPKVAAIGDVHGAFQEFTASLESIGMGRLKTGTEFQLEWTGGTGILVMMGDLTDRGKYTKEVYDAVMDLEIQAGKAGGKLIPLFGNHESLLLNGTIEKWAKTLKPPKQQHYQNTLDSFTKAGLDFHQAISPTGKYGAWIRRRPLFAVVNGFLFVHGGLPTPPQSLSEIAADFHEAMDAGDFNKGIFMAENGPLWTREWWNKPDLVQQNLQAMGVRGVIFGHTVGALGHPGSIDSKDQKMVSVDIGMTPAYGNSKGGALLMSVESGQLVFSAHYPDRPTVELFKVPAPVSARRPKLQPANEQLPKTGTNN